MIVDVKRSEGDGVGSGMVIFGLIFWGVETCGLIVMKVVWRGLVIKPKVFGLLVGEGIVVDRKD